MAAAAAAAARLWVAPHEEKVVSGHFLSSSATSGRTGRTPRAWLERSASATCWLLTGVHTTCGMRESGWYANSRPSSPAVQREKANGAVR
jgi:hypothetical protein